MSVRGFIPGFIPGFLRAAPAGLMGGAVKAYRWTVSPLLPPRCRYLPTCSDYALEALERHGPARGGWLALKRLARCHPLGGSGFDPVPQRHAHRDKG